MQQERAQSNANKLNRDIALGILPTWAETWGLSLKSHKIRTSYEVRSWLEKELTNFDWKKEKTILIRQVKTIARCSQT